MSTLALALVAASLAGLPSPERALDAPAIERFAIDPATSSVGFDGTSTLHDFEGICKTVFGELRVNATDLESSAGGTFWIPVKDLTTDSDGRDEEMYEALDSEHFPRIAFALESVAKDKDGDMSGVGHFTIHGITRSRHFPFELTPLESGGWHAKGGVSFNITDHGVTPPDKIVVGMHDEVRVWFDLNYIPATVTRADTDAYAIQLTEKVEPLGGVVSTATTAAAIWTNGPNAMFERGANWVLASPGEVVQIDPRKGVESAIGAAAEGAFAESLALVASLKAKLAKLSGKKLEKVGPKLEASIERTSASLAYSPPAGDAVVTKGESGDVTIQLGNETWASFTALDGDAPFASTLAALEGVPAEVRKALLGLRGVPTHFELRIVHPTRRTTLTGIVAPKRMVSAPAWILDPTFFDEVLDHNEIEENASNETE